MQKWCLLLSFLFSSLTFAHPTHSIPAGMKRLQAPQVGDVVHIQTAGGWKPARVAKVVASGVLLTTLTQGAAAGPVCAGLVATGGVAISIGLFTAGLFSGVGAPATAAAAYATLVETGTAAATVLLLPTS